MESLILLFILFILVLECIWSQNPDRENDELRWIERRLHDAKSTKNKLERPFIRRKKPRGKK